MPNLGYILDAGYTKLIDLQRIANQLMALNNNNPLQQILAAIPSQFPDSDATFISGNGTMPNMAVLKDSPQLLVLLGGATMASQVLNYVAGVESGVDPRDPLGTVSSVYVMARDVANQLFGYGGYQDKNVVIAGHSLGGAIAQALGAYLLSLGQVRSVRVISFGAPRPGGKALAQRLSTMDNQRWMNEGDIVPFLAPHTDEMPSSIYVAGYAFWHSANGLVQAPVGWLLTTLGQITPSMGVAPAGLSFSLSVSRFIQAAMVGGSGPHHSMAEYASNIAAAVNRYPTPLPRPVQRPEEVLTLRPRERQATIAIARAEIFTDATSPSGETRTYVVPPQTDPASPRYKAARDGKAWVIKLGEEIVGAATGKRMARRVARAWNRAARAAAK